MMDDNNITYDVSRQAEMISTTSLQIIGISSHQLYVKMNVVLSHISGVAIIVVAEEMTAILKLLTS